MGYINLNTSEYNIFLDKQKYATYLGMVCKPPMYGKLKGMVYDCSTNIDTLW